MKKHLLILLCSIFFVTISCRDNNDDEQLESKNQINFQLIGKGNFVGNYAAQQNTVITNTTQWNNFLVQIDGQNNHPSTDFTETNIDFNQFMVIVVIDAVYPNGGHSVDIMTVDENPQNIEIDVEKLLQGNVTTVVTQPYHIVKIPKILKPVIFN
ncbi:protease complex subunit PrcB family protein [Chryseobacterium indoltheticum]|uniref:protease complex subunit PrcB family protein n=1 Tax=Chryseobacterium indoltheticum TaxID=254 RepID=UPI00191471B4|nr:protease complex subunit PrcB family protein [Chryseobacterium indoltheticum]QQQ30006.1 protease complex subunit PrcB family protein [Chryseobacterium indoltheticum]